MALFGFGSARPPNDARQRVETWTRELWTGDLSTGERDFIVKANEIVCADAACPGVETVILILGAGRRSLAFKVAKPLSDVVQDDVARILSNPEHSASDR